MSEQEYSSDMFVHDLWEEIKTNGMYGRSKNDFYDYVLYLLNKHDKGHFLTENDNATNERLLKINATRIKTAKKNISVKFMNEDEYEKIFMSFIEKIAKGKFPSLKDSNDGKSYRMVIEDTALRSAIEARLKMITHDSFGYNMNTEIVTISHEAFITMLAAEMNGAGADTKAMLEEILKELKKSKNREEFRTAIDEISKSDSFQSLTINTLKEVAKFVYKKITMA